MQKSAQKQVFFTVFTAYFTYFGSHGLQPPLTRHKTLETANLDIVQCRNFHSVTVTGHLCGSVKLVQCVTVTGVCWIEWNGTVFQSPIQMAYVNSPVFKIGNNVMFLYRCQLIDRPNIPAETLICLRNNQLKLRGLVHAMHANGPLHQVLNLYLAHLWLNKPLK